MISPEGGAFSHNDNHNKALEDFQAGIDDMMETDSVELSPRILELKAEIAGLKDKLGDETLTEEQRNAFNAQLMVASGEYSQQILAELEI